MQPPNSNFCGRGWKLSLDHKRRKSAVESTSLITEAGKANNDPHTHRVDSELQK